MFGASPQKGQAGWFSQSEPQLKQLQFGCTEDWRQLAVFFHFRVPDSLLTYPYLNRNFIF
jgi:hypothetical protein